MKRFLALLLLLAPLTLTAHLTDQMHLDWEHSGTDINGNPTTLSGFTIYCGQQSRAYTYSEAIPDASQRSIDFAAMSLTDGAWYCAISAVNVFGVESAYSNEVLFQMAGGEMIPPSRVPAPAAPSLYLVTDTLNGQ